MGPMRVPDRALYGASTARAVQNFPISGRGLPAAVVHALGWIKWAAARANAACGMIPRPMARAIARAAEEVATGTWDAEFAVDCYQTGSGTSSNMNANEVIAHRARSFVAKAHWPHPNDHVNFGQSSNDVIPTAIHVAALQSLSALMPALEAMETELRAKARAFHGVLKSGRTHLQDATPIRLGQEFSGYAHQIRLARERLRDTARRVAELPLGGTAVGTGVNTHPRFPALAIRHLAERLRLPFREARNHFQAQAAPDTLVELAAGLKVLAVALMKIGNDLRWLASGPRCGIGELDLPAVQPGSSIMPGKINPVIIESILQVAARVIANDHAVTVGGQWGNFELNTMYPLIGEALCESLQLLTAAVRNLTARCLKGLRANAKRCAALLEHNLSVGTALAPVIGYDLAAKLIKTAFADGATLGDVVARETELPPERIAHLLDPAKHTQPGVAK